MTHRMTQQEAVDYYMPRLESAKIYDKKVFVAARPAVEGEHVETITSDGKETHNVAKHGEMVVQNGTNAKERYIISGSKFSSRYVATSEHPPSQLEETGQRWSVYKAIGSCKAVRYNGDDTTFQASWGEDMVLKNGDMICTPLPDCGEVYRIAAKEFDETYAERV